MRSLAVFRTVLANRDIRLAELGWTCGTAGAAAWLVSLLVYAHDAGGVLAVGLVSVAHTLPAAIAAPFVTASIDRWPRHRVLLTMHLTEAALIAAAALGVALGMPMGIVVTIAVLEGVVVTLHRPANASLLPGLARSPEELVAGNAVTSTLEGIGVLVGPMLAGILLAAGGFATGMMAAAALFAVAASAMLLVRPARTPAHAHAAHPPGAFGGFRALAHDPPAALLVGLLGTQTFVRGLLTVLIVSAAVGPLRMGESGVGFLNAAIGAGGLIGAFVTMGLVGRRSLAVPFSLSLALWGLPIAVMAATLHPMPALALLACVGVANAALDVSGFSLIQRIVPNQVRGRVFGALEGLVALTLGLGSLVAPFVVELAGVQGALVIAGLILPLVASTTIPLVRRADAASVLPEEELQIMRAIPMFAPLPMTSLEALAASLTARLVPAGTQLIREGEVGDRYYILADGGAQVTSAGMPVRELMPGEGFGEIALLRDVPRTATVTVTDDANVYQLDRAAFLDAVTGSSLSEAAADRVVSERLAH